MHSFTSARTCSSVQKMWASSCVKPRTRIRPCREPDGSLRWQLPELAHAQRQIAVRLQATVEDLHVPRAVHRLDAVFAVFRRGGEHGVFVVFPVAGFSHSTRSIMNGPFASRYWYSLSFMRTKASSSRKIVNRRCARTPCPALLPACDTGRAVCRSCGDRAWPLLPDAAGRRSAASCLPGGAVDTLQHFVFAVAAPVSAGGFLQRKWWQKRMFGTCGPRHMSTYSSW